jgi:peptidoglycan/xylan/chitin deacetylase (PgdA/CDA1 family)
MKVVEIRREAEFQQLRSAWDQVLKTSASASIFVTWEWASAWWSSYGAPGQLRILLAYDDDGVLRGIAPLRSKTLTKYWQTAPALAFIGDGSNDSDYLDFVISSGYEKEVLQAFWDHWSEDFAQGTILQLNEIPEASPNLTQIQSLIGSKELLVSDTEVPCATVRLPETWEQYLGMLRPRFRTKVRSVLRNLESRPEVRFGFCQDKAQMERLLPVLFELHAKRWAQEGMPGVFRWQKKRDFYYALSSLLDRQWLRCGWLEWNGTIVACQYGFSHAGTYFHLQEGYEPASEHWNVGIGLRAWSIRELLKEGFHEYDFLGGVGRHKTDWGGVIKNSRQLLLAHRNIVNTLFSRGPEWSARVRDAIKPLVPGKILAVRRGMHRNGKAAAANAGDDQPTNSLPAKRLTNLAAQCYFRLGAPALVRPLRNQYQLSFSRKWPNIRWRRRTQPCGRIFCFHRVNDDSDPFFPAMSTSLFEQEMRILAKYYRVVSLRELMSHLQDGAPDDPVVAITFDDGYQDNYLNAFPILQQLGLPATIFLTTGGLDFRDPLWFEQLALAIKTTSQEFVDLEIDVPRRFWMRTEAERLGSFGRIFTLLRSLADTERRRFLAEAFQRLGSKSHEERKDKMLTWDQVRQMHAHGIDFGGHTVTHPFLSRLTPEQASWEVSECKRRIEQELQAPVDYFAYPNGREADFGEWNKHLLRAAGYRAAVSTIWGMNYASTDPMELRRGGPWERDPAVFTYKLDWYQLIND